MIERVEPRGDVIDVLAAEPFSREEPVPVSEAPDIEAIDVHQLIDRGRVSGINCEGDRLASVGHKLVVYATNLGALGRDKTSRLPAIFN